jgi:phospholipase D
MSPSGAVVAAIITCFSPEQDCARLAIGAIDAAEHEILVSAYVLTNGLGVPAALIRAHDRGIDVELDADRRAPCGMQEGVSALATAGIPVWIDGRVRIAHEKALIIDRQVTIMGSYNWSKAAASNSEDLNAVTSPEVAAAYTAHWRARQAVSVRFADTAQWCQH